MANKLLLANPAKHYMVSSKAPHEYIITNEKQVSRAILIGVSFYFSSEEIFRRYFDGDVGAVVNHDAPQDFELRMNIPWLDTGSDGNDIVIQVEHKKYDGKKTMRFKVDAVYAIKNGTIPKHYLVQVHRESVKKSFCLNDNVRATAHFVIL